MQESFNKYKNQSLEALNHMLYAKPETHQLAVILILRSIMQFHEMFFG